MSIKKLLGRDKPTFVVGHNVQIIKNMAIDDVQLKGSTGRIVAIEYFRGQVMLSIDLDPGQHNGWFDGSFINCKPSEVRHHYPIGTRVQFVVNEGLDTPSELQGSFGTVVAQTGGIEYSVLPYGLSNPINVTVYQVRQVVSA